MGICLSEEVADEKDYVIMYVSVSRTITKKKGYLKKKKKKKKKTNKTVAGTWLPQMEKT